MELITDKNQPKKLNLGFDYQTPKFSQQPKLSKLPPHPFRLAAITKMAGATLKRTQNSSAIEVHFIFRLRQWRGLSNPVLKHRIMEPPFDVLPEPMSDVVFDEQSILFVKKVRQVFSDFDTTVNGARIRDWKMLL